MRIKIKATLLVGGCALLITLGSALPRGFAEDGAEKEFREVPAEMSSRAIKALPKPIIKDLVIADFDNGDKPNNLNGDFGAWDKDPNDSTQGCDLTFVEDDALGDKYGYSIRLDYDVDSPNPAYNGIWMKVGADATPYTALALYLKGDVNAGYTRRIKVEVKDNFNKASSYILAGITPEWQRMVIPLKSFAKISKSLDKLTEFVIVFDDLNSNPKAGTIFVDHIALVSDPV